MNWLSKANAAMNRIPALAWIVVIIVVLALMLSLNHQQAEKLPLEHVAGLYQSDMAGVADVYYNAQMYTDGRYEITRTENTDDGGPKIPSFLPAPMRQWSSVTGWKMARPASGRPLPSITPASIGEMPSWTA